MQPPPPPPPASLCKSAPAQSRPLERSVAYNGHCKYTTAWRIVHQSPEAPSGGPARRQPGRQARYRANNCGSQKTEALVWAGAGKLEFELEWAATASVVWLWNGRERAKALFSSAFFWLYPKEQLLRHEFEATLFESERVSALGQWLICNSCGQENRHPPLYPTPVVVVVGQLYSNSLIQALHCSLIRRRWIEASSNYAQ